MAYRLQPGAALVAVVADNTERWIVSDTSSGSGTDLRVNGLLKLIRSERKTNAEEGYDTPEFVDFLQRRGLKAHITRKGVGTAVDGRTARGRNYAASLRRRKMVKEVFGWIKTIGGLR